MTVNQLKAALDGHDPHAVVVFDTEERAFDGEVYPEICAVEVGYGGLVILRDHATMPASVSALAGHSGDCEKVTRATITGASDVRCSCGVTP